MKQAIIAIVVAVIVIGGGFLIFHKSSKPAAKASSSTAATTNAPAVNNAVLITKTDPSVGQYLADPSGKPLYTYSGDTSGVSNCTGTCLTEWPAYVATGSTANLPAGVGTIKRADNGAMQYTYNGMPLYYFVDDSAGKVTGNGQDKFKVATPSSTTSSQSSSTPTTSSGSSSSSSSNSSAPANPY